ncbi:alanine racemase [Salinibacterium sp. ZJ454]|uniref:alanine racemase n=1 Tax=Salinibacterium sp. ZJ454 TaxID=2708339 RepID=UPI00142264AE|nr:alanine racemase [Salinibacterium sp. ZJ454]
MTEPSAVVLVSRDALRHNVRLVRDRVAPAELLAVVKDNAYGHGRETVVKALLDVGVTRFGALDLVSALAVRELAPDAMIFAWVFDSGDDFALAIRARVDIGVTAADVLERVAAASAAHADGAVPVHLKIDSGLHRAGVLPAEWRGFVSRAAELERAGLIRVAGLWTHIAEASDDDDSRAIAEFSWAVDEAERQGLDARLRHLAASAAAYARADARFDMVRVGAFLYGIAPGGGVGPAELGLRPVMTLQAPVLAVTRAGDRELASIGFGGAMGLLTDAAGRVSVAIHGARWPVTAVHPTETIIDVTTDGSAPAVRAGDVVTLFGDGAHGEATLQEWADAMGTIGEELVTRVSALVPRRVVD